MIIQRFFSPRVRVEVITPTEEGVRRFVSFYGDTHSIYNKGSEEPEIRLVFRRRHLRNYIDVIIHPDKIAANREDIEDIGL